MSLNLIRFLVWEFRLLAEFGVDGNRGFQQLVYLLIKKKSLRFPADVDCLASREVLLPVTGTGAKHIFVLLGMYFLEGSFHLR